MTGDGVLRPQLAEMLTAAGLDPAEVVRVVRRALEEDLALGPDVTTNSTVPADARATGDIVSRTRGVLAGVAVAGAVFDLVGGPEVDVVLCAADGDDARPGQPALTVTGPTRSLLTAERTALNLVSHLSGVATLTRRWVAAVAGTDAAIRDTRKTTPGLRALEKYAVRCGGGVNHRMALGDAALVKDNHVAAAGGITAAVEAVRASAPGIALEVECDTLDQVREAAAAGVELVLLDNFSTAATRSAVELVRGSGVRLEASGGLSLDRAAEVAATGLHYLAVGALTHSAPVLDLGFDLRG
ncbi:carboxylating nicotinate-nucleotide diphosphorylase [Blastococcus haudaquaticus]|uniref:Nicotinate-nucleotide pyrophosphorylase [carboxylating] n=1 Tax=Blastococcus haudaquaticus TaxID=1938745 RepID=A0A286H3K2_9ACTN|nr:carboxylating nicotinate-nucleotide diphosphorylase [Blastococcus haudaquaticus]SOE02331.1 nicotinate-nucleotide pyrophosphorylase [carboxylating] [Blastococcus haudaquaticus]